MSGPGCPDPEYCAAMGCFGRCTPPKPALSLVQTPDPIPLEAVNLSLAERWMVAAHDTLERRFKRAPRDTPFAIEEPAMAAVDPVMQLTPEMLLVPPSAQPQAAPRPPAGELRIQVMPGLAGAGGGWVIGTGSAPLAVAASPEQLAAVVAAWARG